MLQDLLDGQITAESLLGELGGSANEYRERPSGCCSIDTRDDLYGEAEIIEVLVEGFSIIRDGESHKLFIQQAQSNRPWLNNLLSHVVGKPWKIPEIPQLAPHMEFIAELFKTEGPALGRAR